VGCFGEQKGYNDLCSPVCLANSSADHELPAKIIPMQRLCNGPLNVRGGVIQHSLNPIVAGYEGRWNASTQEEARDDLTFFLDKAEGRRCQGA
jgi:hypothetical protein